MVEVSQKDEDYLVKWKKDNILTEKVFRYVIVATGHCSKSLHKFKNEETFQGIIIHEGEYRDPSVFSNKKVVVIGRSFTGSEIAYDAQTSAAKVVQITRKNGIAAKRLTNGLPYDIFYYTPKNILSSTSFAQKQENIIPTNKYLLSLFGNPGDVHPE